MVRKIKTVNYNGEQCIYINRGKNNYIFTSEELFRATNRYNDWKEKEVSRIFDSRNLLN